jgi:hypothetical protein
MKKKEIPEAILLRGQEEAPVANVQATDIAPLSTTNFGESNETLSRETEIRELAFSLYEQRGRRHGHELEDWLEAEAIINTQAKQAA